MWLKGLRKLKKKIQLCHWKSYLQPSSLQQRASANYAIHDPSLQANIQMKYNK
jgi:hypothetical protein